jgi:signal peptidase I
MWLEVSAVLVVAVLVAAVVRTFLLGVYFIPSGSMENTLLINDRVMVDKVSYRFRDIERGDVVVFDGDGSFTPEGFVADPPTDPLGRVWAKARSLVGAAPSSEEDFIKRVIGVPGDRVVCCDPQGRITVNGVALDEPYLYPGDVPSTTKFDIEVPPGRLWVMGDHRGASADSRAHLGDPGGGTVPQDQVIGRAVAVIWPFSRLARLSRPATFQQDAL